MYNGPEKEDLIEYFEMLFINETTEAWKMLGGMRKVLDSLSESYLDEAVLTSGKGGQFDDWAHNRILAKPPLKSA